MKKHCHYLENVLIGVSTTNLVTLLTSLLPVFLESPVEHYGTIERMFLFCFFHTCQHVKINKRPQGRHVEPLSPDNSRGTLSELCDYS